MNLIINPVGKTGKSFFTLVYVFEILTYGVLMKIDNLNRMKLTLIKKIENYRMKDNNLFKNCIFFSFSPIFEAGIFLQSIFSDSLGFITTPNNLDLFLLTIIFLFILFYLINKPLTR